MLRKFLFALAAFPLCTAAAAQAVMTLDKTSHNFGTFAEQEKMTCTFRFTNTGDEPLVLQQVMTSCGCTAAKYSKEPVKPGQKGFITITYDGSKKPAGHFKKVVSVRTNAKGGLVRIYVEGVMTKK